MRIAIYFYSEEKGCVFSVIKSCVARVLKIDKKYDVARVSCLQLRSSTWKKIVKYNSCLKVMSYESIDQI